LFFDFHFVIVDEYKFTEYEGNKVTANYLILFLTQASFDYSMIWQYRRDIETEKVARNN